MKTNRQQIADITNQMIKKMYDGYDGEPVKPDLSNFAAVASETISMDEGELKLYTSGLIERIGKTIFEVVKFRAPGPDITRDGFEWGAILRKVTFNGVSLKFIDNPKYKLEVGDELPRATFNPIEAKAVYFKNQWTAQLEVTLPRKSRELRNFFINSSEYEAFVSSLFDVIYQAIERAKHTLTLQVIDKMIIDTIEASESNENLRVKLLTEFNTRVLQGQDPLTKVNALTTPAFIMFCYATFNAYLNRLTNSSPLYNINKVDTHMYGNGVMMLLDTFELNADIYLRSETYHDNYLRLPENVQLYKMPYWQHQGGVFDFETASKITVKNEDEEDGKEYNNILAVMMDKYAVGMYNENMDSREEIDLKTGYLQWVTDFDSSAYNDHDKNFIVFTLD